MHRFVSSRCPGTTALVLALSISIVLFNGGEFARALNPLPIQFINNNTNNAQLMADTAICVDALEVPSKHIPIDLPYLFPRGEESSAGARPFFSFPCWGSCFSSMPDVLGERSSRISRRSPLGTNIDASNTYTMKMASAGHQSSLSHMDSSKKNLGSATVGDSSEDVSDVVFADTDLPDKLASPSLQEVAAPLITTDLKVVHVSSESFVVRVTVTNRGPREMLLLKTGTPFSELPENTFDVFYKPSTSAPQSRVSFFGLSLKAAVPSVTDYITLSANGGTASCTVDLAALYDTDASGIYTVRVATSVNDYTFLNRDELYTRLERAARRIHTAPLRSHHATTLFLESSFVNAVVGSDLDHTDIFTGVGKHDTTLSSHSASSATDDKVDDAPKKSRRQRRQVCEIKNHGPAHNVGNMQITFDSNCQESDRTRVKEGVLEYQMMIETARARLNDHRQCGPLYKLFFANDQFTQISKAMQTLRTVENVHFVCRPDPRECRSSFAYVYSELCDNIVYLCDAFFRAPSGIGFNTRAGTIVHELSHFTHIVGTKDVCYGLAKCQKLAKNHPELASQNADSLEFYAESLHTSLHNLNNNIVVRGTPPRKRPRQERDSTAGKRRNRDGPPRQPIKTRQPPHA